MSQNRQAAPRSRPAAPMMTDAAIMAKTGKGWEAWFTALDKAGAVMVEKERAAWKKALTKREVLL